MYHEKIFEIQAELCRAMGHPLRMEIMHLLRNGPLNVSDIASETHSHQATISRNLTVLRNAGVVITQRAGNSILYQVANPKLMNVCDLMREVLIEQIGERSKLMGSEEE
jgi:ArsR family transcriptional regulator